MKENIEKIEEVEEINKNEVLDINGNIINIDESPEFTTMGKGDDEPDGME
jgi:hypothetical protein